jgi:hypothetical protein
VSARAAAAELPAVDELLGPAARARVEHFREQRAVMLGKHGAAFAELWTTAQKFIELNGRIRKPPTGWDFAVAVQGLSHGIKPELTPQQRSQFQSFWDWYLPVERNLTDLIFCIRELHRVRVDHAQLFSHLCQAAHMIRDQYAQMLETRRIAWLPTHRGGDPERNIVQRLIQALIECDTGPVRDDGDPGPQWEPAL